MNNNFYRPGDNNGFQYGKSNDTNKRSSNAKDNVSRNDNDSDLVIEENTIYEIDRECYERLKRQKRRR